MTLTARILRLVRGIGVCFRLTSSFEEGSALGKEGHDAFGSFLGRLQVCWAYASFVVYTVVWYWGTAHVCAFMSITARATTKFQFNESYLRLALLMVGDCKGDAWVCVKRRSRCRGRRCSSSSLRDEQINCYLFSMATAAAHVGTGSAACRAMP